MCGHISTAPGLKKEAEDQAIGRSRAGLSTKLHAPCDALGNPTGFLLTAGQAHDLQGADALLPDLQAAQLLADKACDADERVLNQLREKGVEAVIAPKSTRLTPRLYDAERYRDRHLIETFLKLKHFRAIATRYNKTKRNFLAAIYLAAVTI